VTDEQTEIRDTPLLSLKSFPFGRNDIPEFLSISEHLPNSAPVLANPADFTVIVDIDPVGRRRFGQARHPENLAGENRKIGGHFPDYFMGIINGPKIKTISGHPCRLGGDLVS
jgi:hypothetical protein